MIKDRIERLLGMVIPRAPNGTPHYKMAIKQLDAQGKWTKRTSDDALITILEYLDEREHIKSDK